MNNILPQSGICGSMCSQIPIREYSCRFVGKKSFLFLLRLLACPGLIPPRVAIRIRVHLPAMLPARSGFAIGDAGGRIALQAGPWFNDVFLYVSARDFPHRRSSAFIGVYRRLHYRSQCLSHILCHYTAKARHGSYFFFCRTHQSFDRAKMPQ